VVSECEVQTTLLEERCASGKWRWDTARSDAGELR